MRYLSSVLALIGFALVGVGAIAMHSATKANTYGATEPEKVEEVAESATIKREQTTAQVIVNGVALDTEAAQELAAGIGIQARAGRYWYDARSGAFGLEGQGTLGVLPAGLALGGPLQPNSSGGGDGRFGGVFVNGRELHPTDIAGLQQLLGQVVPGRYWVDAFGNFGYEQGPVLGNLSTLAQMRGSGTGNGPRGTRASGCYGDSSCETSRSWLGENYFSDGKTGCIVLDGEITC